MGKNMIFPLLQILISLLFIQTAYSTVQDFDLYHICRNTTQSYTKGSQFDINLNNLLTQIINKTTKPGFWSGSKGHDLDKVFGIGLCRGDVSLNDCKTCLSNAKGNITHDCSYRASIVWHDLCYLKYSYYSFFGQIDNANKVYMWNTANASDPVGFNSTAVGLLRDLSKNGKRFDSGNASFENTTIYGMVQCSGDISKGNCSRCLESAVNELPGIVKSENGTVISIPRGGRTITGSCNVRYEMYPFLN